MSIVLNGDDDHVTTPLTATVTALANNGSGAIRVTTATPHLFGPQDEVVMRTTTYAGSGTDEIVVIDSTHFDLVGSTFTATGTGIVTDMSLTPQVLVPTDGDTFSQQLSGALSCIQACLDRDQFLQSRINDIVAGSGSTSVATLGGSICAQNWYPEFQFTTGIVGQGFAWDPFERQWLYLYEDGGGVSHLEVSLGLDQGFAAAWSAIGVSFNASAPSYQACLADQVNVGTYWCTVTGTTGAHNTFQIWWWNGATWTNTPNSWVSATAAGTFYGTEVVQHNGYVIAGISGTGTNDTDLFASNNNFSTWVGAQTVAGGSIVFPAPTSGGELFLKSNGVQCLAIQGGAGATGLYHVYRTTDGHTWTDVSALAALCPAGGYIVGLAWTQDQQGPCWLVAFQTATIGCLFFRSPDGLTWTPQAGGFSTHYALSDLAAVGPAVICTLLDNGSGGPSFSILSLNGGVTWYPCQASFTSNVTTPGARIRVVASPTGFMMGNGKYIRFSHLSGVPTPPIG